MGVTGVAVGSSVADGVTGVAVGKGVLVRVAEGVRVGIGVRVGMRVGVRVKVGAGPGLDCRVGNRMNGLRVEVGVREGVGETDPVRMAVTRLTWLGRGVNVTVGVKDGVGEKTSLAYSAWVSALSVLMVGVGEPPVFGIWSLGSGMPSRIPAVIK